MSLDDLRRAKVNRAFVFYAKLCSEMLFHCTDNGNKIHMSERKQQEMQVFWDRYDEIRAGVSQASVSKLKTGRTSLGFASSSENQASTSSIVVPTP